MVASRAAVAPAGRLVLGCAQLGQTYGNGPDRRPPGVDVVAELLRAAIDCGVGDADTARAYGDSEAALGVALASGQNLRVVTKVRPLDEFDAGSDPAAVRAAVRASVQRSLAALRADAVDTILLHRARDLDAGAGATVDELTRLVAAGRAGRWGVSVSSPPELLRALREFDLRYVQLPFNMLDRRWLDRSVIDARAARSDVWITARSALLQGLLASDDPRRWPVIAGVAPAAILAGIRRLVRTTGRRDALDLALAYVLAQPWVDAVVIGARRAGQLAGVVAAATRSPLDPEQLAHVHDVLPPGPIDLVEPARWPRPAAPISAERT